MGPALSLLDAAVGGYRHACVGVVANPLNECVRVLDLGTVDNAARGQRIVKQTLQRKQYPGTFAAEFNMKGMAAKVGRTEDDARKTRRK